MSNGQNPQNKATGILARARKIYETQQDSIRAAQAIKSDDDRKAKGDNQNVDDVLSSLYGPVSQYTDAKTLYGDYSRVYESGINYQQRNLSGFDPIDFAASKEWGNQSLRNQALRGGRDIQYAQSQGSAYSTWPSSMPRQTGYGEPWLPGYQSWKDVKVDMGNLGGVGKLNPNSMEDYFYDLAFQDVLKGQVELGNKAQGYGWLTSGNINNTKNNLRQLKKLVGEDNYDSHITDITTQARLKARDWVTQYRNHSQGEMGKAIKAVESRQNVLKHKESIQDLNETIIRKTNLDKTKESLDKIPDSDTTKAAQDIFKLADKNLEAKIEKVVSNPSSSAQDVWIDFANSFRQTSSDNSKAPKLKTHLNPKIANDIKRGFHADELFDMYPERFKTVKEAEDYIDLYKSLY